MSDKDSEGAADSISDVDRNLLDSKKRQHVESTSEERNGEKRHRSQSESEGNSDEAKVGDGDEANAGDGDEANAADGDEANAADGDEANAADGDEANAADGDEANAADGDEANAEDSNEANAEDGDGATAEDGDEASSHSSGYPRPTSHLNKTENVSYQVTLDGGLSGFMTEDEYEEARSCPVQCNLSLKMALATPAELESHAVTLPAADACRLSSVLKARLRRWAKEPEGRTELELQVAVSQELLDQAIRAVYGGSLLIDCNKAESLLLLADYLQMGWLGEAVSIFAKLTLLSKPSLEVCKLAAAHPVLEIFKAAVEKLMESVPAPEAVVDLVLVAGKAERLVILRETNQLTAAHRLDCLLSLSRHPEVDLTHEEAMLLIELQPSLERLPQQSWFRGENEAAEANLLAWGKLYMQQKDASLSETEDRQRPGTLVWDIPLQQAKDNDICRCPATLSSEDGRKFNVCTLRDDSQVGLFVSPTEGCMQKGDCFRFAGVGNLAASIKIKQGRRIRWGDRSLISTLETQSCNTICGGTVLPVIIQMLPCTGGDNQART